MMLRRTSRLSLKLSLYLDGRLEERERQEVERRIETDAAVRREYQQLLKLRTFLAAREPVPENPFLPERIMNRIHEHEESREEDNHFPVSRRFLPAVASISVALLAGVALFAWLQRDDIVQYVEETSAQMQLAYEETILKGWVMPLFERTDRDQVLHFAMFGTLPLDSEDGTILRVDESTDQGYRVELARAPELAQPQASIDDLYAEIEPTPEQRKVFDSLFLYAQRQIESSILMNEEKELAIDPSISTYQKIILGGIAASLEPRQQERFEQFLTRRNTPYAFATLVSNRSREQRTEHSARVMEHVRTIRTPEEYLILSRENVTRTRLQLDIDSLRRLMKIVENRLPRLHVEVAQLARNIPEGSTPRMGHPALTFTRTTMDTDSVLGPGFRITFRADSAILRGMEQELSLIHISEPTRPY